MMMRKYNGIAAVAVLLLVCGSAHGQVIRLEKQVTVEAHADVRLGDLATVTGIDKQAAEELSSTVILSNVEGTRTVKAESVLMALMSQRGRETGRSLQLAGAAQCTVVVGESGKKTAGTVKVETAPVAVKPVAPVAVAAGAVPATKPAEAPGATLTQLIMERIEQDSGLPAERIRITIDTIHPSIEAPLAAGRKWLCRPLSRVLIGTVQFEAQLLEGSRILERVNITTKIEWQQLTVVSNGKFERGTVVTPDMVDIKEVWLDRKLPTLFTAMKDVVGLEAQRSIDVGAMLDQRDFKPALMANKGDGVTVYFIAGALKVQMHGRAMEDGKLHDMVQVKNEKAGEVYQATLIGKRLAVVGGTLSDADEKLLREAQ